MQNYVVDSRLRLLPAGVPGELLIAGEGVAAGYLNRPDLTEERFVDNPFGPGRAYRTGDLVRWREDGQLLFLGRRDRQVKIRGNRVELEEVEAALRAIAAVQDAAVVAHGNAQLVAYVVFRSGAALSGAQLRRALADQLPDAMVPDLFLPLISLPRMPNGKVDHQALPAPDAALAVAAADYAPPQGDTESALADLWAELLGVARVGRDDNFFELGGHSLIVTRLVARIRASYEIALPIRALFDAPTVATLARQVDALRWANQVHEPPTAGDEREEFEF
jgi:acyl carrier protein